MPKIKAICSDNAFWDAIKSGVVEQLEKLNYTNEQLNLTTSFKSSSGYTPLLICAAYGHVQLMEHLISLGINKRAACSKGNTAIIIAAREGRDECLSFLIKTADKHDLNVKNTGSYFAEGQELTALMMAAHYGHLKCVRLLIQAGADINLQDHYLNNAIYHALSNNHILCAKELFLAGAKITTYLEKRYKAKIEEWQNELGSSISEPLASSKRSRSRSLSPDNDAPLEKRLKLETNASLPLSPSSGKHPLSPSSSSNNDELPKPAANNFFFPSASSVIKIPEQQKAILAEFSDKQKVFYAAFQNRLKEGFLQSLVIAKGNVILEKDSSRKIMENAANIGLTAGGLIPAIGTTCTSVALINHIVQMVINQAEKNSAVKIASRIANLAPELEHIIDVSRNVAVQVSIIYANQIDQLKNESLEKLATYIAAIMFHYIATDRGNESSYLKQAYNFVCGSIISAFTAILPYLFQLDKSEKNLTPPEFYMLEAIVATQLLKPADCNEELRLLLEDVEKSKNCAWYAEELLKTGIITPEKKKFIGAECKVKIYGYRTLPEECAKKLGFKEQEENSSSNENNRCRIM